MPNMVASGSVMDPIGAIERAVAPKQRTRSVRRCARQHTISELAPPRQRKIICRLRISNVHAVISTAFSGGSAEDEA